MEAPTSLDAPVLPARGPEDLLAYVGHALGRLPEDSLVLLTLHDGRLRAVVRVDLPPEEVDVDAWACAVAEVCRRDAAADAGLPLRREPRHRLAKAGVQPDGPVAGG